MTTRRDWQRLKPDGTPDYSEEQSFRIGGKGGPIGYPDDTGNVYALDRQGRPFVAYNTRGMGPRGISTVNTVAGNNASVYNQGGTLMTPKEGKKRLRDYYLMMMGENNA